MKEHYNVHYHIWSHIIRDVKLFFVSLILGFREESISKFRTVEYKEHRIPNVVYKMIPAHRGLYHVW